VAASRFGVGAAADVVEDDATASVVILLALVAYGEDRDVAGIVDLEQRHVPGIAKRNDEFPQQRPVARPGLAAGERRVFEQREGRLDCRHGAFRGWQVALDHECLQPLEVLDGLEREANAVTAHDSLARDLACPSWRLSDFNATPLDT